MYNLLSEKKILATFTVLALASIMVMGPAAMTFDAFATADNDLEQEIEQSQYSTQLGICISGDGTFVSCNNLSEQDQDNDGDNFAVQFSDDGGDNEAEQEIEQSQYSTQLGICISGDGTLFSCNNLSEQDQDNDGDNFLVQSSGGYRGGDNEAEQEIEQEQSSEQSALCISGDGTFLSCNNVNDQDQDNDGDNFLVQSSGGYRGGDNEAEQSIEQEQESEQNSFVASGDDSEGSGNNENDQDQDNDGDNVAVQG
ncbi:MAG TPA: hypothetical protein VFT71_07600 [Candidatus Nitrosocosmicus sp.]|nr:hypothetical protein [Candidatus Nitrosocosmicus sp.]